MNGAEIAIAWFSLLQEALGLGKGRLGGSEALWAILKTSANVRIGWGANYALYGFVHFC